MRQVKLALHWQMGIALVLGLAGGWLLGGCYSVWGNVVDGIGKLFLHAINMIVIPLVFLSTLLGISTMSNTKSMGRVALKTFLYFIITAVVAAIIGVLVTDVLRPGYGIHCATDAPGEVASVTENAESVSLMERIVSIIPNNVFQVLASGDILPIIFFSLMLGLFITKIKDERQHTVNNFFEALLDAIMKMTTFIIKLAPLGVFAIVMSMVGRMAGNADEMKNNFVSFAFFILVVWTALILMGGVVLPIMVAWGARVSPVKHLKQIYSALLVAFSTSSSYSALPLIISDAKEKLGVSNSIASFTVPLGITFNKIGTVIYECVAVIFVTQIFEIELSLAQQVSLIGVSIVTVLGAPSVPMAGVVVLAILLKAMGLPDTYIGMFMAVDILCDMPKTLLNAYSVSCSAIIVARSEGEGIRV